MEIIIEEYSDAFDIVIKDGEKEKRFYFDQEDDKKKLVKVFKYLGFDKVKYEVVC